VNKKINYLQIGKILLFYNLNNAVRTNFEHQTFLGIISVTNNCNLKCNYCHIWDKKVFGTSTKYVNQSLTLQRQHLMSIVKQCASLKIPYLTITGGEPLLVPYIFEIGQYARSKKIFVNLNTNGTLINSDNRYVLSKSFDSIRISINGSEKIHDSMCQTSGTYKKVVKELKELRALKTPLTIGINVLVNDISINNLNNNLKNLYQLGDFITLLPRYDYETFESKDKLYHNLPKMKHKKIDKFLFKINNPNFRKYCDAGKLYFCIFPNGEILSCPFQHPYIKELSLGNINNVTLERALRKQKNKIIDRNTLFRIFKKHGHSSKEGFDYYYNYYMKTGNFCSGCQASCTTLVSYLFRKPYMYLLTRQ
jgi:MoaA/NifB/PqqE/SkfB family radical SAM enzyme